MDKEEFYRMQAESFRDYAGKNPSRDLLSLFNEWAESKDIYGADKHMIWKIARHYRKNKEIKICNRSKDYVAISAVLRIVMEADLKRLDRLMAKK